MKSIIVRLEMIRMAQHIHVREKGWEKAASLLEHQDHTLNHTHNPSERLEEPRIDDFLTLLQHLLPSSIFHYYG